jgi:hypothetical protein
MSTSGSADDREGVVGEAAGAAGDLLRAFEVLVGDDGDADGTAGTAGDLLCVALEDGEGTAADGADAEQANIDGFHRQFSVRLRAKGGN